MHRNEIVEDFQKTLTQSFFKSGKICGVSEEIIREAYNQVKEQIYNGFSIIDSACDKFSKIVLSNSSKEIIEEKTPEGLELIFVGRNGSRLYLRDSSSPLVVNDTSLLDSDLYWLKKSFYPEDYLEADKIHKMILSSGIISLDKYLKQ